MDKHQFIPGDWKRWVAENVLQNQPKNELVRILVENGFSADLARVEVDDAYSHPYLDAAKSSVRKLLKRDWLLSTQNSLRSLVDFRVPIVDQISETDFLEEYYAQNMPVVIKGEVSGWPAFSCWTYDYLRTKVGNLEVEVQSQRNKNPNYEMHNDQHRTRVRFHDYLALVFNSGPTNDFYMTANNTGSNSGLLDQLLVDCGTLEKYCDPTTRAKQTFFWMGPQGTVTPLHHDLTNNFMAQIVGRKLIRLICPQALPLIYNKVHCFSEADLDHLDLQRFPMFKHVKITDLILEPGDLFFLPVGWWHYVRGLDATITITCTNLKYPNSYTDTYRTFESI